MHVVLLVVWDKESLLSASLLYHNKRCSALWQKQLIPPPTVELSVSFPIHRTSIVLTFAVSTGLALFPWVVSQAYPTPNPYSSAISFSCLHLFQRHWLLVVLIILGDGAHALNTW